jgi:hypothetical protein
MDRINSLIQAARARTRGYRSIDSLIAVTHLIAGRHDLSAHGLAVLAKHARSTIKMRDRAPTRFVEEP